MESSNRNATLLRTIRAMLMNGKVRDGITSRSGIMARDCVIIASMAGFFGSRSTNRSRVALLFLYAFVVAASAFFHHDLACRQDSRTHCTACSVSQDAQRVESHGGPLDANQRMSGRVELRAHISIDVLSLTVLS